MVRYLLVALMIAVCAGSVGAETVINVEQEASGGVIEDTTGVVVADSVWVLAEDANYTWESPKYVCKVHGEIMNVMWFQEDGNVWYHVCSQCIKDVIVKYIGIVAPVGK